MKRLLMFAQTAAFIFAGCLATATCADEPQVTASGQTADASDGDSEFDDFGAKHLQEEYARANVERYDMLRSSTSPRQQVLAGTIYLDREEETPALVRPRRADVIARAVELAPDDAFVQWMAADQGSYTSSQCGPSKRPETEVANLIRLEPDNAAAWRFAVALASAIGDEAGVDDALSRMASASRADDHSIEQLDEWTRAYQTTPNPPAPWQPPGSVLSNDDRARLAAIEKIDGGYSSAASVMLDVCKMEVDSERIWQRLGWCADAATTLASRGSSLALREQGLAILAAIGTRDASFDALQRQYDWLNAHKANPVSTYAEEGTDFSIAIADWKGATSEIDAIVHRLKRLGQPLEAPPGWNANTENGLLEPAKSVQRAWMTYTNSLVEGLRTSTDAREQAAAISASAVLTISSDLAISSDLDAAAPQAADVARNAAMGNLAAANPDNLLVQWIAARSIDAESDRSSVDRAIANVQRLDPDNGASWALSLAVDPATADLVLPQIATGTRFDDHGSEILALWMDAARRRPPSDDQAEAMRSEDMPGGADLPYGLGAAMMSTASMMKTETDSAIARACLGEVAADSPRRQSCVATARLLLSAGASIQGARAGEWILRKLDALDDHDASRARAIAWWLNVATPANPQDGAAVARFMNDVAESGSEVEALRLAAQRAGKADPPQSWQSPAEMSKASKKPAASKITEGS